MAYLRPTLAAVLYLNLSAFANPYDFACNLGRTHHPGYRRAVCGRLLLPVADVRTVDLGGVYRPADGTADSHAQLCACRPAKVRANDTTNDGSDLCAAHGWYTSVILSRHTSSSRCSTTLRHGA